jgi:hypothetical protein
MNESAERGRIMCKKTLASLDNSPFAEVASSGEIDEEASLPIISIHPN